MNKLFLTISFVALAITSICQNDNTSLIFQNPQSIKPDKFISAQNCEYFVLTDDIYAGHLSFALFQNKNHLLIASGVISLLAEDDCFSIEPVAVSNDGKHLLLTKECSVLADGTTYLIYDITSDSVINDIEIDWGETNSYTGIPDFKGYDFSSEFERSSKHPKYYLDYSKTITIREADSGNVVWESGKQKSSIYEGRGEVPLDNNIVLLSTKDRNDRNEQFIWYDFVNKDTIFSTKNPFGVLDFKSYLIDSQLVLPLKKYPFKLSEIEVEIDLSSGLYDSRNYPKKADKNRSLQKSTSQIIADSVKSESPYFSDAHQSLWHIFRKYYNRDGSLKDPSLPGQINRDFYPSTFWYRNELTDSLTYNWYVFSSFDNKVVYMDVNSAGIIYVTLRQETNLQFWNGNKKDPEERKVNLMYIIDSGPFFYTDDLYYMTNANLQGIVSAKHKGKIYPIEQFDLKYNRPDIILDRLGYADAALVDAYHAAYLKRLKKMSFSEDMLQDDFHLPEIEIENIENIPQLHDGESINLDLKLKDSKYKLDRINVWVNDVAIYGRDGISLRDKNVQEHQTTLEVFLTKGKNKVQVSVLNQAGAESYKETFDLDCTAGKDKPDLYLITIGESEFQQADFDLTYAAKDANDIAALFKKSEAYKEVHIKTLVNQEVTKENVLVLRSFIEQAGINDEVMIFIAGHGVLDANLDYYFATHDMDFQNPKERGLAYEDLESLLDGIKPLKKTLIIDACHSGEIDKEEVELAEADINEGDNIQFRAVGNTASPKLGMKNTSELTKSLFTDLRKGTGATVISSAGGMEFAMEGDDWNNGLFTYCLIEGITSKNADSNNDGEIWLSEIQRYVSEQVTLLSGGLQQPTSRIENQTIDFRIW